MAIPLDRTPLDPHVREFLEEQAAGAPDLTAMSDPERVQAARDRLVHALRLRDDLPGLPVEMSTRDLVIAHDRPARLYTPKHDGQEPRPLLIYLHGGGWVAGSLDTVDPFCKLLSQSAGVLLLSVDYRQPPEHRFPAVLEDALAAVQWASAHAQEFGGDATRLAVGGDSAGGNLAAAVMNRLAADPNGPELSAQLLLYPVTDHPSAQHRSYEENATGYGLTAEAMRWFWRQYAPDGAPENPDLSPLRMDRVQGLPPTLVATAEYDVLRDEGIAYVEKLRAAGVVTTHFHAGDMHHDFPVSPATVVRFPQCLTALQEISGWLRGVLHTPLPASRH